MMNRVVRLICIFSISLFLLLTILIGHPAGVSASTDNGTIAVRLTLTPTFECIGAVVQYAGDDNQNNSAVLEYHPAGGSWKTAPAMYADRIKSQYRGSIFWLTANTVYEVRVTFSDPDNVSGASQLTARTTTRNDNPPSNGHKYYVSPNGSNSNPGSLAQPFKTIQKAANSAAAGDSVIIGAGKYSGDVKIKSSGNPDNYITFTGNPGEKAEISGGFVLDGKSYIRISGLTVSNTNTCVTFSNGSHDNIIEKCQLTAVSQANKDSCILISSGASNILIQDNDLVVNGMLNPPVDMGDKDAVYWWHPGGGNVFRRNTVSGTPDGSGKPWDGFGGGPEDSDGYTDNYDFYANDVRDCQDDAIQPDGSDVNTRVWSNTLHNTFSGVSTAPCSQGPIYIFRNVMYDLQYRVSDPPSPGNDEAWKVGDEKSPSRIGRKYFFQNTIYAINQNDAIQDTNAGGGNIYARNNIFYASWYVFEFGHNGDCDLTFPHSFDYDVVYSTDLAADRFIKWNNATTQSNAKYRLAQFEQFVADTGNEIHGIPLQDCRFVDPADGDFHLQDNSGCIDAGEILPGFNDADSPWPYTGAAPDIGAYEWGLDAPLTGNPIVQKMQGGADATAAPPESGNSPAQGGEISTMSGTLPTAFEVSSLILGSKEIDLGQSVDVQVSVSNTGDLTGSYVVPLKIDGIVIQTREVTLKGGDSQLVKFTLIGNSIGQHQLEIAGLQDTLVVNSTAPIAGQETSRSVSAVWILVFALAGVVGAIISLFIRSRRRIAP